MVESSGLLNRRRPLKSTEGSNPSLSAIRPGSNSNRSTRLLLPKTVPRNAFVEPIDQFRVVLSSPSTPVR